MCGRFAFFSPREAVLAVFGVELPFEPSTRYNIAPSQAVVAIRAGAGGHAEGVQLRWGLVPSWAREPSIGNRMINARAETLAVKPAFRRAFRRRRCVVLASGFYEWRPVMGGRQPCYIAPPDGQPIALAALWERWEQGGPALETCAIVTTGANATLRAVHDRMPVIIPPVALAAWLDQGTGGDALGRLLRPAPDDLLEVRDVSRAVNSPAHEGPRLIAPLEPPLS